MPRKHTYSPKAKPTATDTAILWLNGLSALLFFLAIMFLATNFFVRTKEAVKAENKIYLHTPAKAYVAKTN